MGHAGSTHKLPIKAKLRATNAKEAGATVTVHVEERIDD